MEVGANEAEKKWECSVLGWKGSCKIEQVLGFHFLASRRVETVVATCPGKQTHSEGQCR